ncbi:MAG: hypothetical protein CMB64_05290 [Euryarchaeota archaeon]|nr:hypothetical protein [Euryarchaeota archaeon]
MWKSPAIDFDLVMIKDYSDSVIFSQYFPDLKENEMICKVYLISQDTHLMHAFQNSVYIICLMFDEYGELMFDTPYTSTTKSLCLRSFFKYYIIINIIYLILVEEPINIIETPISGISYTKQLLYNRWNLFTNRIQIAYREHVLDNLYRNNVIRIRNLPDGCTDTDIVKGFDLVCRVIHFETYKNRLYRSSSYSNNRGRVCYVQFKDKSASEIIEIHNRKPFRITSKLGSGITQTPVLNCAEHQYLNVFQGNYCGKDYTFQLA